jgi:hypothetical protein
MKLVFELIVEMVLADTWLLTLRVFRGYRAAATAQEAQA